MTRKQINWLLCTVFMLALTGVMYPQPCLADVSVEGNLRLWQPITLSFAGPTASELDDSPNPFLDYRLQVVFTGPDGRSFDVPGFFDGDGSGGSKGNVWRIRFAADSTGDWTYKVSFRRGKGVAVELNSDAGEPVAFDGLTGKIQILARSEDAPGFLKWGRLEYTGGHYLKFRDGPYWLRGGTDSPENFLAYAGFDDTPVSHDYAKHKADWRPGDPDWGDGRGKAIIGALNYLASKHVNSIYALTMNVGGDGKDVWPWAEKPRRKGSPENDNLHFDLSKLSQWNEVFTHAQRQGIFLHLVLGEGEEANKRELDDGELGPERKLYYREMVARFGHHLALQWNLCEEYNLAFDLGHERIRAFADYLQSTDPYDHPITVHSAGDPIKKLRFTFGDERFSLTSIQLNQRRIDRVAEAFRAATQAAGRPLPVCLDEFTVDMGQKASWKPIDNAEKLRKEKIWPTYFSGGMLEIILEGFLDVDSFKGGEREAIWAYLWYARKFAEDELPFWKMEPNDQLVRHAATIEVGEGGGKKSRLGPQVFALAGEVYAIYFPSASSTGELDLRQSKESFTLRWYNPRTGEFTGKKKHIEGGGWAPLGDLPAEPSEDWVALIKVDKPTKATSTTVFPDKSWQEVTPERLQLSAEKLNELAEKLGGRGMVIKEGYVVKQWGDQTERCDWFSAAKPVLGTLLLFAIAEGKVSGVDAPVKDFGWDLKEKDREMTLRHLANMQSGYARPEVPGEAWAYNDFGVQLYQKTIFDRILQATPETSANDDKRFGALGLEDGLRFTKENRRLKASVRDFARIAWFWLQRGKWDGEQLIPGHLFDEVMRPQTPADLPHTGDAATDDDLEIGSFGGGSDHFTKYGAGIYGFNWWFNSTGRLHPEQRTWPDAPADLVMAIGFGGNCCALLPSQNAVLVAAEADWGKLEAGRSDSWMNHIVSLFAEAVTPKRLLNTPRQASNETKPGFQKVVLTNRYYSDGICAGDINRDGYQDIVSGPFWYEGPTFSNAHEFYPAVALRPEKSPSNSMFSFVYDVNGDGWLDILVLGRVHLQEAYWYQNPGQSGSDWIKHFAFERVYGESPAWIDLDGDGLPQLVCHWQGRWGWIEPDWSSPYDPWKFRPISPAGEWKEFYHGTGVGDLNGDGRLDLVLNDGWFTQPEDPDRPWNWHPHQFSDDRGGAQMFAYDVDRDGDSDVISSLNAHGWGLAWFEQYGEADEVKFRLHKIMGSREEIGEFGVAFSQPHALDFGDIDGDGLKDIVVGKRMWAHGPDGDVEPGAPPVLYWFQLKRQNGEVQFKPHLIDDRSGVGVQVTIADINNDGANDILTASKLGSFVFINGH